MSDNSSSTSMQTNSFDKSKNSSVYLDCLPVWLSIKWNIPVYNHHSDTSDQTNNIKKPVNESKFHDSLYLIGS